MTRSGNEKDSFGFDPHEAIEFLSSMDSESQSLAQQQKLIPRWVSKALLMIDSIAK